MTQHQWYEKTAVQEFAWPDTFTDESKRLLSLLARTGPNAGTVDQAYLDAPPGPANAGLAEAAPVIMEMAANYGRPMRHNNPNPFYTRDGQQCSAMASLLHGRARLVLINPGDYLALSPDWEMDPMDRDIRRLAARFRQGLEVDAVYFTVRETGQTGVYQIINQEGRHRAYAAAMAGVPALKAYLHSSQPFPEYGPATLIAQRSDYRVALGSGACTTAG